MVVRSRPSRPLRASPTDLTDLLKRAQAQGAAGAAAARGIVPEATPAGRAAPDTSAPVIDASAVAGLPSAQDEASDASDAGEAVTAVAQTARPSSPSRRRPHRSRAVPVRSTVQVKRTLNVEQGVSDAVHSWLRVVYTPGAPLPKIVWLLDAALADLPVDVDDMQALVDEFGGSDDAGSTNQISGRFRPEIVERLDRALLEIRAGSRRRELTLARVVSAAIRRQLAAEGVPLPH